MTSIAIAPSIATTPRYRQHLAEGVALLGRFPRSLQQLLFRFAVAGVFMKAGLTKIASWETTVALFRDEYKVPIVPPEIAALLGTTFELGCSTLLIVGLGTRLATLPLLGMLTIIQLFVYPSAWADHLTWGSILIAVLTRGAGAVSIDRLIGLEPRDASDR